MTVSGSGTLTGSGTIFGKVTLTGGGTINLSSGGDIAGPLTITGGNWIGTGTVTGLVTLSSGSFNLTNNLTATAGLTITGGTLAQAGTLTGNLNYLSGASSEFDGELAGASTVLTKGGGSSTLTLAGISTYGGATNVNSGTLQIGNGFTGNIPNTSVVNIASGAVLMLNLPTGATFSRSIVDKGTVTATGTQSNNYTISSPISGTGTLVKTSSNTVTITGANSYSGATTVSAGILQVGDGNALGISLGSGIATVNSNATLSFDLANGEKFSGNVTDNGHVVLTDNGVLLASGGSSYTVSGIISGTGDLTEDGTGVATLTGTNTYTGGTILTAGELSLGSSGAIGTKGTISFGGGSLQFTSANTTDYSAARFSSVAGQTQAYSIDTNGQNVTFGTAFGGAANNNSSLTKLGAGTLTLSAMNTFTGSTIVDAGVLHLAFGATVTANILSPNSASRARRWHAQSYRQRHG